jgi:hypothetical protein
MQWASEAAAGTMRRSNHRLRVVTRGQAWLHPQHRYWRLRCCAAAAAAAAVLPLGRRHGTLQVALAARNISIAQSGAAATCTTDIARCRARAEARGAHASNSAHSTARYA